MMSRGDRKEPIFRGDADRKLFLKTLGEACGKTGWWIHSLTLMNNHFHLVVETPGANLVAGMKWLLGTYTTRFNRRHKLTGHLFAGRYKALVVDGSGNGYLKTVCDYVHLNPSRARLVKPEQPLKEYRWSSWPWYLGAPSRRPDWLRVERLMGEHGIPRDSNAGRRELERRIEAQRVAEATGSYRSIRRGWCLGGEDFRRELLGQPSTRLGAEHYGTERREAEVVRAERIVKEELRRREMREADLPRTGKGDRRKVEIAARLRAETTLSVAWIATRLGMGSRAYLNHLLWKRRRHSDPLTRQ